MFLRKPIRPSNGESLPDTLQVHWSDLDDMSDLFTFQDAVTASASHARHVQQLGTVDHVVVWKPLLASLAKT